MRDKGSIWPNLKEVHKIISAREPQYSDSSLQQDAFEFLGTFVGLLIDELNKPENVFNIFEDYKPIKKVKDLGPKDKLYFEQIVN